MQLPDSSVIAGDNITILAALTNYYGTPSPSILVRTNYGQGQVRHQHNVLEDIVCVLTVRPFRTLPQTLSISMESKTPQISMAYSTSDDQTPANIIQLEELIHLSISIAFPEVSAHNTAVDTIY